MTGKCRPKRVYSPADVNTPKMVRGRWGKKMIIETDHRHECFKQVESRRADRLASLIGYQLQTKGRMFYRDMEAMYEGATKWRMLPNPPKPVEGETYYPCFCRTEGRKWTLAMCCAAEAIGEFWKANSKREKYFSDKKWNPFTMADYPWHHKEPEQPDFCSHAVLCATFDLLDVTRGTTVKTKKLNKVPTHRRMLFVYWWRRFFNQPDVPFVSTLTADDVIPVPSYDN